MSVIGYNMGRYKHLQKRCRKEDVLLPKIVDFEQRKQEIVEKAMKVFIEKGYHKTNLADIAKECNIGRTTLYQYFKDKDEIFDYVAEQFSKNLETDCRNILENKKLSAADKLKMTISLLTLQYQLEKNKMLMMIEMWLLSKRENDTLKRKLEKHINVLRKVFEQLLDEGIKTKEFKEINPKAMAFTISTLVETFVVQAAFANNISYQEHLNNIYALLNGLKA